MSTPSAPTGKLSVVATPIGNLADVSERTRSTLCAATIILAEDTRHSAGLLDRLGAKGRRVSCHAHNELERCEAVVGWVREGEHVALITDAGAPVVSDPGGRVVEAVGAAGLPVEVIPGPSALIAALMGAGIDITRFAFLGFLPSSKKARNALVDAALRAGLGVVLYEAPQRAAATLDDLFAACGPRRVVVARELTKLHETFHRGTLGGPLAPPLMERGEMVIVVEAGEMTAPDAAVDVDALRADASLSPKARAQLLAKARGISVREAYQELERLRAEDAAPADAVSAALKTLQDHLVGAGQALIAAHTHAGGTVGQQKDATSDVAGADALMRLLAARPALRAPVEQQELARALLSAQAACEQLHEALSLERDATARKKT